MASVFQEPASLLEALVACVFEEPANPFWSAYLFNSKLLAYCPLFHSAFACSKMKEGTYKHTSMTHVHELVALGSQGIVAAWELSVLM